MDFSSTFKLLTHAGEVSCGFVLLGRYYSFIFNIFGLFLIFLFSYKILRFRFTTQELLHFFSEFYGTATSRFPLGLEGSKVETLARETVKSNSGVRRKSYSGSDDGVEEKEKDENVEDEKLREYMSDEDIDQLEGVDASRGFLNFAVEYDENLDDASIDTDSETL
ncbi:hypothetical protein RIF29_41567 [Crotalaria pallida]|uniref:Uncharacterized protein n=1 Tax=Crotalaria pallida TaxID=3830 RepID=A0AAN9EBF1_CROPI